MNTFLDRIKEIIIILKWLIEENPKIFRMENIVIPLIAATVDLIKQNKIMIFWCINIIRTEIGIIFWIVIMIKAVSHSSPSITEIIQKWNGNIPNFKKIAI